MKKIRIAGAQIPIKDNDIQYNKNEILKSLDWAKENNVDLIQTPEAALSGYNFNFWEANMGEIVESLKEIESKQKEYGIGLNLGTCIVDYEMYGAIKRNQVRHYSNTGELYGITNKTYLVHADGNCIPNFHDLEKTAFKMRFDDSELLTVGLICNDMWGSTQEQGKNFKPVRSLNETLTEMHVDIIFHSTHGFKFAEVGTKDSNDPKRYIIRDTMDLWSEAWLRMTAFRSVSTLLTVDSCVYWDWDGNEDLLDKIKTSSPSGVINPIGQWETNVPRYGRQYFYYDLDPNLKKKYWDVINLKSKGEWLNSDMISYSDDDLQIKSDTV
tara:strand:- start:1093 stop:2070 length:978 start_codon:yes stop_codon:yes gene_type:complete